VQARLREGIRGASQLRGLNHVASPRYWMNARPRGYERDDCRAGRATVPGLTGVRRGAEHVSGQVAAGVRRMPMTSR
jgi:hypothetical protein